MMLLILSILLTSTRSSMHDAMRTFSHMGYAPLQPTGVPLEAPFCILHPPSVSFSHFIGPMQVEEGLLYLMVFKPLLPAYLPFIHHQNPFIELPSENTVEICRFLGVRDQKEFSQASRDLHCTLYEYRSTIQEIFLTNEFLSCVMEQAIFQDGDLPDEPRSRTRIDFDLNQSWTNVFERYYHQGAYHPLKRHFETLQISGSIFSQGFGTLGQSLEIQLDSTVPTIWMKIMQDEWSRQFRIQETEDEVAKAFSGKITLEFLPYGTNVQICDNDREEIFQLDPDETLQLEFEDDLYRDGHQVSLKWRFKESQP